MSTENYSWNPIELELLKDDVRELAQKAHEKQAELLEKQAATQSADQTKKPKP